MTALLQIKDLTLKFDGIVAVDRVNLMVAEGETHGLIGPNGAGKTTLFNAISGLVAPVEGQIIFREEDITRLPTHRRAACGIRRTFQTVQLVQAFTVYENLLVGLHTKICSLIEKKLFGRRDGRFVEQDACQEIERVLQYLGMAHLHDREVRTLTIAEQRLVEIGQALVSQPKLIMLDEPTAGLTPSQMENLERLLAGLAKDWNTAVLLVEHVVSLVMNVCSRVTVLDRGQVIADGTGPEVVADQKVRAAYLGDSIDA